MKTLLVMPLAEQRGGAELALLQLVSAPGGGTWHVAFLEEGPMVDSVRAAGAGASVVPAGRLRQPHRMAVTVVRLARLARRVGAGAVLSWMGKAHLYGGPAARLAGVPAMWFQHSMPDASGWIDFAAARIPTVGILACSHFVAEAQRRLAPRVPVRIVYPAADLDRYRADGLPSPAEARRLLGLPLDSKLVGAVGRLQRQKGMHTLVESLPAISARHPRTKVVIVGGDSPLEPSCPVDLRQDAERLRVENDVIFVGQQPDIPIWMAAFDVFVLPSKAEGFGMVVVEAMALGKPIVAGSEGGPREVVTDGVDGLLAPYGDPAALAEAVCRYLDDPAFAARVGAAARERAQEFSVERYARGVADAVAELTGGTPRAGRGCGGRA